MNKKVIFTKHVEPGTDHAWWAVYEDYKSGDPIGYGKDRLEAACDLEEQYNQEQEAATVALSFDGMIEDEDEHGKFLRVKRRTHD